MNLNYFSVANALAQSAAHLELHYKDELHAHIATILYKEAEAIFERRLKEFKLNDPYANSSEG